MVGVKEWMDRWMDGWVDGRMGGWKNGMDGKAIKSRMFLVGRSNEAEFHACICKVESQQAFQGSLAAAATTPSVGQRSKMCGMNSSLDQPKVRKNIDLRRRPYL
jgi:hypothetical protein